jgi:hypothetical protein
VQADATDLVVVDYQFVSSARAGRTAYDYTYAITVRNPAQALSNVVATASSVASNVQIVERIVALGDLGAGAIVRGTDTFVFRLDRRYVFDPASIVWTFTAEAESANSAPVARAGPDQTVFTGVLPVAPAGASVDSLSGQFSFAPQFDQLGVHGVTARAQDENGAFDTQSFTIEVLEAPVTTPSNTPPTLEPIENQVLTVGDEDTRVLSRLMRVPDLACSRRLCCRVTGPSRSC